MGTVIRAEGIGKRYRLGHREPYGSLRDSIARAATAPIDLIRRLAGSRQGSNERPTIWALKDVSFSVDEGEIVGLIGRNGSGKSTLLKILSRITDPSEGRAEVRGWVGSLLEVGTGFHPELTGRENVFVNGAILGMKRREILRKFDEIVAFADVDRFIDTPVKHYSSGMQMRLAFAVAAHLEPTILLVDEVLAVGDLAFQKKCLGKMNDVSRDGKTVVFVSHQMNQLRRLCGRCLWLESGRLIDAGPTADVANRYEATAMEREASTADVERSPGARFLTWTLGASGSKHYVLDTFAPTTVRFTLRVDRPLRNVHHGIVIYDRDNQLIWGTGTDNLDLRPGLYEISYALDMLPLRPGPYRWHLTIYENGHFVDGYDSVPEMSVETPPLGHRQDVWAGILNLPHVIDIKAVESVDAAPLESVHV